MADGLDLGNLVIHLKADIAQYEREMKRARDIMNTSARKLTSAGVKMSLAVTVPLVIIGKKSVTAFAAFDEAMTNSTAIMRNLAPEMREEMEKVARTLSTTSRTAAVDLAKGYEYLALAGLDAVTSMKALPKVNEFAIAGAFDMATATDLLTDAQDALRMSSKDTNVHIANMAKLADAVSFAATQANDSIQGFATMLTRDAGVASKNLNMELNTTLAVLSAYASQGIKGAQAGNTFGRATRLLTKAARENGKVWKQVGVKVINETTGEYRNFIDILGDLESVMVKLTAPDRARLLDELGFAALAQKSILPLIGMTDKMRIYESALADAAGTTGMIAAKQQESFNAQIEITKNMLTDAAISIGATLAPALVFLNGKLREGVKWWNGLSDTIKSTVVWVGVAVAAVGPLLLGLASVIKLFSIIIATMTSVAGAVIIVAVAFAALGTYLYNTFEWVQTGAVDFLYTMAMVWEGIRYAGEVAVAGLRMAWDSFWNWLDGGSRDAGKKMFEDAKKATEDRMKLYGEIRDETVKEIQADFKEKKAAKEQVKVEEEAVVAAKEEKVEEKMNVDDMLGKGDGLTQFGTGEAIGNLGFEGLTSGADNQLENMAKQQLSETKKQTDHLANIEENTEWA